MEDDEIIDKEECSEFITLTYGSGSVAHKSYDDAVEYAKSEAFGDGFEVFVYKRIAVAEGKTRVSFREYGKKK